MSKMQKEESKRPDHCPLKFSAWGVLRRPILKYAKVLTHTLNFSLSPSVVVLFAHFFISIASNGNYNKCPVIWHNRKVMTAVKKKPILMRWQNIAMALNLSIQPNINNTSHTCTHNRDTNTIRPMRKIRSPISLWFTWLDSTLRFNSTVETRRETEQEHGS